MTVSLTEPDPVKNIQKDWIFNWIWPSFHTMTDDSIDWMMTETDPVKDLIKDWVFDWIWPSFHTMTGFAQLDWAVTGCPA